LQWIKEVAKLQQDDVYSWARGSSVVDYVISDIPISNQIVSFDLLNDHEPDFHHRPLTLTLNFSIKRSTIEENSNNQRQLLFEKTKVDPFLKGFKYVITSPNL
jgi:hypothetical protein